MNYICMDAESILQFPRNINFEYVPGYINFLGNMTDSKNICFDLSGTELLHASFIGFLLHAKNVIEKNNKNLTIKLSGNIEHTLRITGVYEHFSHNIIN